LKEISKLQDKGNRLGAKKQIDAVIDRLSVEYSALSPETKSHAFRIAANAYSAIGDLEQAESYVNKTLRLDPINDRNYVTEAKIIALKGDGSGALAKLKPIDSVSSFNLQLGLHLENGDKAACESLIQTQLPDQPNHSTFHLLASYYFWVGDLQVAQEQIQRALDAMENWSNLHLAGRIAFCRALERFGSPALPNTSFLINVAGNGFNDDERGRLNAAVDGFERAAQMAASMLPEDDPAIVDIHVDLLHGLAWVDDERAKMFAHDVLQRWPNNLYALQYFYITNHLDEVSDWNDRLDGITPDKPIDILIFANLLAGAERFPDALAQLEAHRELASDERYRVLWYQLTAAIHRRMDNPVASACLIDEFESPPDAPLLKEKIRVNHYMDIGDYASARPIADHVAQSEGSPDSLYVAYMVSSEIPDWEACEGYAQKLVAAVPTRHYQQKHQGTIETIQTARNNGIEDLLFDELVGLSHLSLSDYQPAADALEQAYQNAPVTRRNPDKLRVYLAGCYFHLVGKIDRSIQLMEEQIGSERASPDDFLQLAVYYQCEWRLEDAYQLLQRAISRFPEDEGLWGQSIILGYQADHEAQASQDATRFMQTFSESRVIREYQQEEAVSIMQDRAAQRQSILEHYLEGVCPRILVSALSGQPLAL